MTVTPIAKGFRSLQPEGPFVALQPEVICSLISGAFPDFPFVLDPPALALSLSPHRHPFCIFIYIPPSSPCMRYIEQRFKSLGRLSKVNAPGFFANFSRTLFSAIPHGAVMNFSQFAKNSPADSSLRNSEFTRNAKKINLPPTERSRHCAQEP